MCFGASGSEVSLRHQEQNREAGKAQTDNIWKVGPGCYIWYQSRPHWLSDGADGVVRLLKGGGL